jgi:GDP-L-fucose synthase
MKGKTNVVVLGHTGFLGNALHLRLLSLGFNSIGLSKSTGFDLRIPGCIDKTLAELKPSAIINCAALVGGIEFGRTRPAEIYSENLKMTLSILESASKYGVKLVNPISNCAYPNRLQIFSEDEFWDGPLDESVLEYGGVRKFAWIGARAYEKQFGLDSINLVFPNMYGPGDHLDPVRAHALGALVFKFCIAKSEKSPSVTVWGSGAAVREWMYIDDAVDALILAISAESVGSDLINIGTGLGISIKELASEIGRQVGYEGDILFDLSMPDGAPYKTMNGTRGYQVLNWKPKTNLPVGIKHTIRWYQSQMN